MSWIKDIWQEYKERRQVRHLQNVTDRAAEIFDVRLHDSQLWLCYCGNLIAPMILFQDIKNEEDFVNVVTTIRTLYINRNAV